MISRGTFESNAKKATELGFTFPIIVQEKWEISRSYGLLLTPCAFLIDEHGVIAAEVAIGPEPILTLLRGAAILSLLQST